MPNVPSRVFARSLDAQAPSRLVVEPVVRRALFEDTGRGGDLTTDSIVASDRQARACIVARKPGTVAGTAASLLAFSILDGAMAIDVRIPDGEAVAAGETIAEIGGNARAILTAERTALNLLSRLCGIATATRRLVDLVKGTKARIADTRKTTPGMRALEKYAVRCGGGVNHRFGLDDAVLIKDNHLALAGSIRAAVAAVRARVGHMVKVEVEVDTLDQLREALDERIDAVLLDNMDPAQLATAVAMAGGRVLTEASGGVSAESVAAIAASGVDLISVGALTHSAPALDLGLDMQA